MTYDLTKNISKNSVVRILLLAVAVVAIMLTLIPWYASYLTSEALRKAGKGFQVEALHTAEKAVSFNPISVNALFVLAGAQQRMGREAEARKTLIKATELQPQNYATWRQLAVYERDYWRMPEEAKLHFQKAIELNPGDKELRREAGLPEEANSEARP